VVLNAEGEPVGTNDRLLATSTFFSVDEVVQMVQRLNGLCIPCHIDRPAYSLIANLGFIPPDLRISGVEISHLIGPTEAYERFPQLKHYSLIASGDAHRLKEMAGARRSRWLSRP